MKVKSDYIIYCDESCPLEYEPVTLFGAISCSYNKKDQIVKDLRNLKNKYFINSRYETKWIKVSKTKLDYYKELIDYFYNNNDIKIRILVAIDKERLNNEKYNGGEYQEWYYKMYYYLLENFIKSDCSYYMLYDEKDKYTTYRMNKVKDIIINKLGKNEHFDFKIKQINSKESELMQLLDVVMGAVGYKNRGFLDKENANEKSDNIKVWKTEDYSTKRQRNELIKIRFQENEVDYLIILKENGDIYYFVTAYLVFEQREKNDLDKEYNSRDSKKIK